MKKPLNAFLGELFIARWEDGEGTTRLVSEQVSHHPPVTACRVWNEERGVSAEGFTRQEITFKGSVSIKQIGYAILRLEKWHESYLIPLPNVKVSGILTGTPYPELGGVYFVSSSSGYMARVEFEGKGWLGGKEKKHSFEARLYKEGEEERVLYSVAGHWDREFVIRDEVKGEDIEVFDSAKEKVTELKTEGMEEMDEWETRKAWKGVREALQRGDMLGTSKKKNEVEQGQRQMRKDEAREGKVWERVFFKDAKKDVVAEMLASKIGAKIIAEDTMGIWAFDESAWNQRRKPYHGRLRPDNKQQFESTRSSSNAEQVNGVAATVAESEKPEVANQKEPRLSIASPIETTNSTADLPLAPEVQQEQVKESRLEEGVVGLRLTEQNAVEDMLRNQYSSS